MKLKLSISTDLTRMSVPIMDQLGKAGEAASRIHRRILKGNFKHVLVTQRNGIDVYGEPL